MDKLFFIVNATAGSGRSGKCFDQVRRELDKRGISYGCEFTQAPHHAEDLTRAALLRGESTIVAVGGDGTINEIASVMCGNATTMGILPFGTGNDLAKVLKLPTDPDGALEVLLNGTVRPMDAGMANDKFFINIAGLGFDVDVLVNTEKYKKHFNGMLPYMLGVINTLSHLRTLHITLTVDGKTIQKDSILVAVGNGTHFGGGMKVTPLADPFDGLFDVCLIEIMPMLKLLSLLPGFVNGKHLKSKQVHYFNATEIVVECDEPCMLDFDGELGSSVPAKFTIIPGAINILVAK
ncbi:MAG: diacylglycerol kinase family lipid kinase [Clostridia bacterium]